MDDPGQLELPAPRRRQGRIDAGQAQSPLRRHLARAQRDRARHLYEEIYCARGEMENRIKECQLDLFADRTSTATMQANQLRLWFASMAYVLICALRRIGLADTVFAEATCGTIRLELFKIGALVSSAPAASNSPWHRPAPPPRRGRWPPDDWRPPQPRAPPPPDGRRLSRLTTRHHPKAPGEPLHSLPKRRSKSDAAHAAASQTSRAPPAALPLLPHPPQNSSIR